MLVIPPHKAHSSWALWVICPKLPEAWQCDQMTEQKIWPFFQTNRPKYLQQFLLKRTFFISPKSCQLFWLNLSSRPTKISQSGHTASCPTFRPGQHRPERQRLLNFFAISDTFLLKSHLTMVEWVGCTQVSWQTLPRCYAWTVRVLPSIY